MLMQKVPNLAIKNLLRTFAVLVRSHALANK
nr:MAG TPA: hypothetical protein [Caudoviricetes sp.]